MGSTQLSCTKMAWTKASSPNVNYRSGNYATELAQNRGYAYLGFTVPNSIRYKPLTSIEVYNYGITTKDQVDEETWIAKTFKFVLATLSADWQESSITYNTAPAYSTAGESALSGARDLEAWLMANLTNYATMKSILERGYRLQVYSPNFGSTAAAAVQVSTRYNSTSSLRPYIIVYYEDDNVYLTPVPAEKTGYVNPHVKQTFSWSTTLSRSNAAYATPTQSSARLLYKLPSDTDWTSVTLTGITSPSSGSYQASVAANTLPVAEQLLWKISITDSGGTTTESEEQSILTKDSLYTVTASSPSGSKVNETVANTFRWTNSSSYGTAPTGAELQWRESGGTWAALGSVTGSATSFTVPANTFPAAAALQWRARSKNADGDWSSWSTAANFSTVADLLTAVPAAPIDTVENRGDAIRFRWNITGTGSAYATKSDLQTSADGTTWTTLTSPTAAYYDAPAESLNSGQLYWRVRSYNRQNTPGSWSAAVSFIVYGAPDSPSVSADGAPFTTITWQSSGQQAYRIRIYSATPIITRQPDNAVGTVGGRARIHVEAAGEDLSYQWQYQTPGTSTWIDSRGVNYNKATFTPDVSLSMNGYLYRCVVSNSYGTVYSRAALLTITTDGTPIAPAQNEDPVETNGFPAEGLSFGPFFGEATSYSLDDYLRDGVYTVSVEIQGSYGLWSNAGSYTFNVTNSPGGALTLDGQFETDAELFWTSAEASHDFYVYRDGARIGRTFQMDFTDRLSLGSHSWQVINRLSDGNYSPSNIVTGTVTVDETMVAALDGGEWLMLRLSANSEGQQDFTFRKSATLRHVAGAVYPVLELAPFADRTGSYDTAFSDPVQAAAFEALQGKVVVLKSRRGNLIIGALLQVQKREGDFFTAFTFTIQRVHWEDYLDDTNR